jgi:hypothetical protein
VDWILGESCGAQDVLFVSARPMFVVGNQITVEVGVYLYSPLNFNHWSKDSWTNLLKDQTSQVEFEIRL